VGVRVVEVMVFVLVLVVGLVGFVRMFIVIGYVVVEWL